MVDMRVSRVAETGIVLAVLVAFAAACSQAQTANAYSSQRDNRLFPSSSKAGAPRLKPPGKPS